jgi:hypothetical protein
MASNGKGVQDDDNDDDEAFDLSCSYSTCGDWYCNHSEAKCSLLDS